MLYWLYRKTPERHSIIILKCTIKHEDVPETAFMPPSPQYSVAIAALRLPLTHNTTSRHHLAGMKLWVHRRAVTQFYDIPVSIAQIETVFPFIR